MKVNLGAGDCLIEGYDNLDAKTGDCIYPLSRTNLEEIRASHILEHFGQEESYDVLVNWTTCLADGGVLKIAVPDFDELVRLYTSGYQLDFESVIMGGQSDEYDYHKSMWTADKLRFMMEQCGLTDIKTWQSNEQDCAAYPFSLNLQGVKSCQG